MILGERLRDLREHKGLSQGDIEKRTGLLRCYISRVENGHTVPAIETLEKLCRALDVPLYHLFYDGHVAQTEISATQQDDRLWGARGRDARMLILFRRALGRASARDRQILLSIAQRMVGRRRSE